MRTILPYTSLFLILFFCSTIHSMGYYYRVNSTNDDDVTAMTGLGTVASPYMSSLGSILKHANTNAGPHTINFASYVNIQSSSAARYEITNSNITIDASGSSSSFIGTFAPSVGYGFVLKNNCNNVTIKGLMMGQFATACIYVESATNFKISGCYIGTNVGATYFSGYYHGSGILIGPDATNGLIGGNTAADRNYFCSSQIAGVTLDGATGHTVTGNYFNVQPNGTSTIGSSSFENYSAVLLTNGAKRNIIGKNNANERNLFVKSTGMEIKFETGSTNNVISGNYFGYSADKATTLEYYKGIVIENSNNNTIQYNSFSAADNQSTGAPATNDGVPIDYVGTAKGNILRVNSFQNHELNPNLAPISSYVHPPTISFASTQRVRGKAAPGDKIEIYYGNGNSTAQISGLTFVDSVTTGNDSVWTYTPSNYASNPITAYNVVVVTATNKNNKTTSWFVGNYTAGFVNNCTAIFAGSPITICESNARAYGIYLNGAYMGSSNGTWTSSSGGSFSPNNKYTGMYGPYYIPKNSDYANGTVTLTLRDNHCVNATSTRVITINPMPKMNATADIYSCSAGSGNITTTPEYVGVAGHTISWTANYPIYLTGGAIDNPTYSISYSATQQVIKRVTIDATGCYNADTFLVAYKPTPYGVADVVNTVTERPVTIDVTKNDNLIGNEELNIDQTLGYFGPSNGTILVNGNKITYVSNDGYIGTDSYSYYMRNDCGNTTGVTLTINVGNAPPRVSNENPVSSYKGEEPVSVPVDICSMVSDPNDDVDCGSITIISNPVSGAMPYTYVNGVVVLVYGTDYAKQFVGEDYFVYQICDGAGNCTEGTARVSRIPDYENPAPKDSILVYNGISPDGDGVNDFMRVEYIGDYRTTVMIYNRWGEKVWEGQDYDNLTVKFEGIAQDGKELPEGTYFYVIKNDNKDENGVSKGLVSGPLELRRSKN